MLSDYIKKIAENITQGDSREESFYSSLEQLLDEYAHSFGKKKIHITTLPKSTEAGNPDFRVWDGKQKIVGYIEAKNPAIDNLDTIENSEQLCRYRHTFPNLMLTIMLYSLKKEEELTFYAVEDRIPRVYPWMNELQVKL